MSEPELPNPDGADYSPAVPLEITAEKAREVDDILQNFAETAELDTALVVHSSGCLVSGISSEADVTVDVISALVASASGALKALGQELKEFGELESFHQGDDRSIYFKALPRDFVLVGVSSATVPVGLVREAARQNVGELIGVLEDLPEPVQVEVAAPPKERQPLRAAIPSAAVSAQTPSLELIPVEKANAAEEPAPDSSLPELEAEAEEAPETPAADPDEGKEPTEVIELLGGDEPEIVIDGVDSPFETVEDDADEEEDLSDEIFEEESEAESIEEEAPADEQEVFNVGEVVTGSIFEVEEGEADDDEGDVPASIFEEDPEEEIEEVETLSGEETEEVSPGLPENIFEVDDEEDPDSEEVPEYAPFEIDLEDDEEEETPSFELDEEDVEEVEEVSPEEEEKSEGDDEEPSAVEEAEVVDGEQLGEPDEEETEEAEPEEEEGVRSSGPFYF